MAPSGTRTHSNKALCYAKLLCSPAFLDVTRGERMGGDSNPWCLAAHTLSRRAQSTALSPILSNPARNRNRIRSIDYEHEHELQLQPAEQLIKRQGIPVPLVAAPFAHVIKADHRPIGQCRINPFLPIMRHPLRESFHRCIELRRPGF